jgi:hypothetical protein
MSVRDQLFWAALRMFAIIALAGFLLGAGLTLATGLAIRATGL